jgi:hypothetical protein
VAYGDRGTAMLRQALLTRPPDFDFSRSYQLILDCYLMGQINEAQWQRHLEDEHFAAWVTRRQREARR